MNRRFEDKVVLVTGAAGGMGLATARLSLRKVRKSCWLTATGPNCMQRKNRFAKRAAM